MLLGRLRIRREIPEVEVKEFPTVAPQTQLKEPETLAVEEVKPSEEELELEFVRKEQIKGKVTEYIKENSEQATRLIKVWLLEEEKPKWQRR
jgi:flagellar biosynthesis/type III secretory pathway M-ring protein FliF/YscJ